jgi:serine/threonine-protein kinase RsbW
MVTAVAAPQIKLVVPGTLRFRDVAVRTVAEAARLVSAARTRPFDDNLAFDVRDPFDTAVVSAFMELFNNVAIHAYAGGDGELELTLTPGDGELTIELLDHGRPFDPAQVAVLDLDRDPADPAALPEGGMGLHIARTMLDELVYIPGPPNRWRLIKRLSGARGT